MLIFVISTLDDPWGRKKVIDLEKYDGHDTDASRTTSITGNLDVSAGVDVTGSITCSVDLDIEEEVEIENVKMLINNI